MTLQTKTNFILLSATVFCILSTSILSDFAYAESTTYSTPGTYNFTVPSNVTSIQVKSWGAGGSNGGGNSFGAGGGFGQATITVTPNSVLKVVIGSASGGGAGGSSSGPGGSGGGYSGVFYPTISQNNTLIIAGGGGGGGGTYQCTGGSGGPGGGNNGASGQTGLGFGSCNGVPGGAAGGGTNSSGGAGGPAGTGGSVGSDGSALTGGAGASQSGEGHGGGGGGSGYYGGGGGGSSQFLSSGGGGGGGGGSSYATGTGITLISGYDQTAGNPADPDRPTNAGNTGNTGAVVLIFGDGAAGTPAAEKGFTLVATTDVSKQKNNLGTSYVDIYNGAFEPDFNLINFTGYSKVRILSGWDYNSGDTGSHQIRWVNANNNTRVLYESSSFTVDQDPNDSGWVNLPTWAKNETTVEWQGKSTVGADDPIAKYFRIFLR